MGWIGIPIPVPFPTKLLLPSPALPGKTTLGSGISGSNLGHSLENWGFPGRLPSPPSHGSHSQRSGFHGSRGFLLVCRNSCTRECPRRTSRCWNLSGLQGCLIGIRGFDEEENPPSFGATREGPFWNFPGILSPSDRLLSSQNSPLWRQHRASAGMGLRSREIPYGYRRSSSSLR